MTMAKRTPEDVEYKVRAILVKELGDVRGHDVTPNSLADDAKIGDDLGADSLDRVELVMAYEEEFGIEISDDDAEGLNTVREVISYLQQRVADKAVQR